MATDGGDVDDITFTGLWRELRRREGILMSILMYPTIVAVALAYISARKENERRKRRIQQEERWRQEAKDGD